MITEKMSYITTRIKKLQSVNTSLIIVKVNLYANLLFVFIFTPIYRPLITLNGEILHLESEDAIGLLILGSRKVFKALLKE